MVRDVLKGTKCCGSPDDREMMWISFFPPALFSLIFLRVQRSHLLPKDLIVSWCVLPTPSLVEALRSFLSVTNPWSIMIIF